MKLLSRWALSAGLVLTVTAANAQGLPPYGLGNLPYDTVGEGPYARMVPEVAPHRHGPSLLPAAGVYTVLRESGFSPLGIPRLRGFVYTISVIDRSGDDGRLVIDARTGQIIRFMPAARMGDDPDAELMAAYGPVGPPVMPIRGVPRPPAPIPHVASRAVPLPKAAPSRPVEGAQTAAVQAKPTDAPAKPAEVQLQIQPTQEMPAVQGLE